MIDGAIPDTHDPQRGEDRCVYGSWQLKPGWYAGDLPKAGDPGPELIARCFPMNREAHREVKGKTLKPDHPV